MKTAVDILLVVSGFVLFGFIHSYLASGSIKKRIADNAGDKIAFYRVFYNAVALITLIVFFALVPKPDQLIYELKYPYDLIIFGLQIPALAGIVWSFAVMDLKELSGIAQVVRYYKGTYRTEDLDGEQKLIIHGPHKISRHPMYTFIILFLALRPAMDLFYLTILICTIAYFYIGAYFEEKKLIERFGVEYLEYKKRVSGILPVKFLFGRG